MTTVIVRVWSGIADGGLQGGNLRIDERDLAVVRPIVKPFAKRRRRIVRAVRIEQVYPQQIRLGSRRPTSEPCADRADGRVRPPLGVWRVASRITTRKLIVVDVEAACESESAAQRKSGDEGRGLVARGTKPFGERRHRLVEHEFGIVADAMARGSQPGEQRRVRGQRQRRVCHGVGEPDAAAGERVEGRRGGVAIAVAAEVIGPQRVDGDHDDVGRRGAMDPEPSRQRQRCRRWRWSGQLFFARRQTTSAGPRSSVRRPEVLVAAWLSWATGASRLACARARRVIEWQADRS